MIESRFIKIWNVTFEWTFVALIFILPVHDIAMDARIQIAQSESQQRFRTANIVVYHTFDAGIEWTTYVTPTTSIRTILVVHLN